MNIDWSKAPEGATQFDPATGLFYRRRAGTEWEFFINNVEGWRDSKDWSGRKLPLDRAVSRAVEWGGQGLPPVGTEQKLSPEGRVVQVLAHGVVRGEPVAICQDGALVTLAISTAFRTAEQIEVKEREKFCEDIAKLLDEKTGHYLPSCAWEALYDAGYRKFEIVEGE